MGDHTEIEAVGPEVTELLDELAKVPLDDLMYDVFKHWFTESTMVEITKGGSHDG